LLSDPSTEPKAPSTMKPSALIVAGLAVVTLSVSACAAVETPDSSSNTGTSTKTVQTKPASQKREKRQKKEKPAMTSGQENAIESAESYLDGQAFSKRGLIDQLKFEDYSKADAKFAANHVHANWKAEAVESAQSYLDGQSFSKSGLIDQLKFEKFTSAQAQYAADKAY
jgi:hypothetical protein